MRYINGKTLTGERALYMYSDVVIERCVFENGESPLKESKNLTILDSEFGWKYPIWYCKKVDCHNIKFKETARSGIWYTNDIKITDSVIDAPKTFRRSSGINLVNVKLNSASETLWNCEIVSLLNVEANGDYFGANSKKIVVNNLTLNGNYVFDGGKDIEIHNSVLNSKDAIWNCENVLITDSVIIGEYLGWNSKNVTFINCKIVSHQGLCYVKNLKMINCELNNSDLCFEFSENIDASISSEVDSIKNPSSGRIIVNGIKELILEDGIIDKSKTEIIIRG